MLLNLRNRLKTNYRQLCYQYRTSNPMIYNAQQLAGK